MVAKKGKQSICFKTVFALFTTFFIVLGILAIGFAALDSRFQEEMIGENDDQAEEVVLTKATSGPALIVIDDLGVRIRNLQNDKSRELIWPDDASKLGKPVSQIKGVDLDDGNAVWLDPGFGLASAEMERSPDGRRNAFLSEQREDGSTVMSVAYGSNESGYVLRAIEGDFLTDVEMLGWLNEYELAFMASLNDLNRLFVLNVDGSINELLKVSNHFTLFTNADDGVIFVEEASKTLDLNDAVYRYNIWYIETGSSTKIVEDLDAAVQAIVSGEGCVVYSLANQKMFIVCNEIKESLGMGSPLQIISGKLLYTFEGKLYLLDLYSRESLELASIQYNSIIFYLDDVIWD